MEISKLALWLSELAAGCQAEPKQAVVEAYLEQLEKWKLNPAQWAELKSRAIMRHRFPRMLPVVADLYDIACEISQEDERKAEEKRIRAIEAGPREPMPEEVRRQFELLKRAKG
jgi:hypothetical protein